MSTALIVDDDAETLVQLANVFREKGYSTETSSTLAGTREALLRRLPEAWLAVLLTGFLTATFGIVGYLLVKFGRPPAKRG